MPSFLHRSATGEAYDSVLQINLSVWSVSAALALLLYTYHLVLLVGLSSPPFLYFAVGPIGIRFRFRLQ